MSARFAYLFERFPSYTQTFCFREVAEMHKQGVRAPIFSIRPAQKLGESDFPEEVLSEVSYLPENGELQAWVEQGVPAHVREILQEWGKRPDKLRLYTAAYLGPVLDRLGIGHVHAHFAGMAARTAYWLKRFYGIGYSFTGHANDIFCHTEHPVQLSDLIRESRLVATETNYSRNWLCERFPQHAEKIFRVYNGIDVEKFRLTSREMRPLRIISVGRCIEKKGFGDLIEACRLLKAWDVDFSCEIIGTGPLEGALGEQIASSGLEERVRLAGPQTEAQVIEAMARANLFVLACVKEAEGGMDNLPTVIMEAMASGLAVISTKLAGIPEMIGHDRTGLLVNPNSPLALAEAMARLAAAPEELAAMGERGKALAREKFSSPVTTAELRALIERYARLGCAE